MIQKLQCSGEFKNPGNLSKLVAATFDHYLVLRNAVSTCQHIMKRLISCIITECNQTQWQTDIWRCIDWTGCHHGKNGASTIMNNTKMVGIRMMNRKAHCRHQCITHMDRLWNGDNIRGCDDDRAPTIEQKRERGVEGRTKEQMCRWCSLMNVIYEMHWIYCKIFVCKIFI